jgi:serine/threonine protein phosphatase PrpC
MEQPCQDAHHWRVLPAGILVAAVADGAGSAIMGEVGAKVAARTAVGNTCARLTMRQWPKEDEDWRSLLSDILKATRTAVEAEASAHEVTARDLATTLILTIATAELVVAVQVGDGAAVAGDSEDDLTLLTVPQSGEYINETTFLISPEALDTAQMTVWRGTVTHIAIFSDGLQRLALKMPDKRPHAPFFSPLFHFATNATDEAEAKKQLATFLGSQRVTERTDDDVTLLLAACVHPT